MQAMTRGRGAEIAGSCAWSAPMDRPLEWLRIAQTKLPLIHTRAARSGAAGEAPPSQLLCMQSGKITEERPKQLKV